MSPTRHYKPHPIFVGVMVLGFSVIVFIKLRKNGWVVADWKDIAFYIIAPIALVAVSDLFLARVTIEDDHIEIKGLFYRKKYYISDITQVSSEGGMAAFKTKDARWVRFPNWLGRARSVAAVLRHRLKARDKH